MYVLAFGWWERLWSVSKEIWFSRLVQARSSNLLRGWPWLPWQPQPHSCSEHPRNISGSRLELKLTLLLRVDNIHYICSKSIYVLIDTVCALIRTSLVARLMGTVLGDNHPPMPGWLIILILIRSSFACTDKLLLLFLTRRRDCLVDGLYNLCASRKKEAFYSLKNRNALGIRGW